jgi:type I restriction enzyme M protein
VGENLFLELMQLEDIMNNDLVPPGKIKCYVSGKLRQDTPEERIRQEVARSLVEEYKYDKKDMEVEFKIEMGRAKKKADIVVFNEKANHKQENIIIIAEVKQDTIKPSDKDNGIEQLKSYVAASLNCKYALWVGTERISYIVSSQSGKREVLDITDIPKKGESFEAHFY